MTNNSFHKEYKPQKVIAEKAGCSQSVTSEHINGKLTGRGKFGRKTCTSNRDDCSLARIVKTSQFKNLAELHKEWTQAGMRASKVTKCRCLQERGYKCHIANIWTRDNVRSILPGLRRKLDCYSWFQSILLYGVPAITTCDKYNSGPLLTLGDITLCNTFLEWHILTVDPELLSVVLLSPLLWINWSFPSVQLHKYKGV